MNFLRERQSDVAKLNKDLDDLHEASLKEIRAVSGDLQAKVSNIGCIFIEYFWGNEKIGKTRMFPPENVGKGQNPPISDPAPFQISYFLTG